MTSTCPLKSACLMSAQNAHGFILLIGDIESSWATSARTSSAGHLEQGVPTGPSPSSLCRHSSDCSGIRHTNAQWSQWDRGFIWSKQLHSTLCFGAKTVLQKGTGVLKKNKEALAKLTSCPWVLNCRWQGGVIQVKKASSPHTPNGSKDTRPSALQDNCLGVEAEQSAVCLARRWVR